MTEKSVLFIKYVPSYVKYLLVFQVLLIYTCYVLVIQCPEVLSPGNGMVRISPQDRTVGSTATFQCSVGYQLIGQASVQCQQNRQWSSQPPTCQCKSLSI